MAYSPCLGPRHEKIIGLIAVLAAVLNALIDSRFSARTGGAAFPRRSRPSTRRAGVTQTLYIPTDSVMVYTLDPPTTVGKKSGVYTIDMMIAINRADISYVDAAEYTAARCKRGKTADH